MIVTIENFDEVVKPGKWILDFFTQRIDESADLSYWRNCVQRGDVELEVFDTELESLLYEREIWDKRNVDIIEGLDKRIRELK